MSLRSHCEEHDSQTDDDGYSLESRRSPDDSDIKAKINMKFGITTREIEIDSKEIVPYCFLFSRLFQAHINVKYSNSVNASTSPEKIYTNE
jgi:hypothetical protein